MLAEPRGYYAKWDVRLTQTNTMWPYFYEESKEQNKWIHKTGKDA